MSLTIARPSSLLSGFVKQYWAIEHVLSVGEEHMQRIIPCGLPDFTFYFKDKPRVIHKDHTLSGNSQVSGHRKGYLDLQIKGELSLFSIVFHPQAMMLLFDFPIQELFDQYVPLKDIFRNDADQLEASLFEAPSFSEKVRITEHFLCQRIYQKAKDYECNRIFHTISKINQTKANIGIDELASEVCLSRKQFERTFSKYIGTSPKLFLRTVRFQNVLFEKGKNDDFKLTALAHHCGYFDQSHMIGEFKTFTGMTPGKYFSEGEVFSDYFNEYSAD